MINIRIREFWRGRTREFWDGWHYASIFFGIAVLVIFYLFPSEFEKKGRKKLCELKQYEYCTKEELLKEIK